MVRSFLTTNREFPVEVAPGTLGWTAHVDEDGDFKMFFAGLPAAHWVDREAFDSMEVANT